MRDPDALANDIATWRGVLSAVPPENRLNIFEEAANDVARRYRGLGRVVIGNKLNDLAVQIGPGLDNVDARQRIIAAAILRAANASAFRQTSGQFVADFVPPDYQVDGVLIRRYLYSSTGRTGSGKTSITLLLTACVALGLKFGELETVPGCVFYLCGENPDDVRMRWIALAHEMGFDPDTINVYFFPARFKISEQHQELVAEAQAVGGVALVIVDTSQAYFEGNDPNNNAQQVEHALRLRTLTELPGGPTVVVNCHPVKNAAPDNLIPYGGGAFLNEVDGNLTCTLSGVVINIGWQGKFREPDFPPLTFRVRSVTHERLKDSRGRLIQTVVAEHLSESAQQEIAAAARKHEDQLLAEIAKNGHASLAKYAERCGWAYSTSSEPNKTLVRRTIDKLKDEKLITQDRDGYTLSEKGEKALKNFQAANTGEKPSATSDPLKVVGDCPQSEKCALCLKEGNDNKGPVQKIALNRANATALSLHRECAEQWFHIGKYARTRDRYPRN